MDTFLKLHQSYYPDHLRSDAFRGLVKSLSQDPQALARLTIGMLDNIALDPLEGNKLSDFVKFSGPANELEKQAPAEESIWFGLQLDRVSNFVGFFTLPCSAPECDLLLAAIQRNLDSKMFKAAAMHRRFEKKVPKRSSRFERLGSIAYHKVLKDAESNPLYLSRERSKEVQDFRESVYATARVAADDVIKPLVARREARHRKAIQASTSADFGQGYPEMLTSFASKYVVPEGQRMLAQMM